MASAADGHREFQFRRGDHCEGGAPPFRALGGDPGANRGSILSAARMGRTPADDDAYRDALYRSNHQAWREAWRRDGLRWWRARALEAGVTPMDVGGADASSSSEYEPDGDDAEDSDSDADEKQRARASRAT